MNKKFICSGEPYEVNGEKKIRWNRIGEIFAAKSGKEYAKLYFMPGQLLSVFEDNKEKPAAKTLDPDLNPDENVSF